MARYTQQLCSYPKCCVVADHVVGPDVHRCTASDSCRHLVHLICQGHYADKQRQQSRLEEDEADWCPRCYNCELTCFQKLLRDSLHRAFPPLRRPALWQEPPRVSHWPTAH
jgi:hypothetical protein